MAEPHDFPLGEAVRLAAIVTLLALFSVIAATSQTPTPLSSPNDVEFTVKTRGGQTTFRIGEVIPLELSLVSSSPDKYRLDTATYDRSGRLNEEQFTVEPNTGRQILFTITFTRFRVFLAEV